MSDYTSSPQPEFPGNSFPMVVYPVSVFLWTACSLIFLTPMWVLVKTPPPNKASQPHGTSESTWELGEGLMSRLYPSPWISQDKDGDKGRTQNMGPRALVTQEKREKR